MKAQPPVAGSAEGAQSSSSGSRATSTGRPEFQQVRTRRGYQEIFDQIRGEISAGRLQPGDRLPAERDMAVMFGVSRQAVREALRGLEIAGLVSSRVGVAGGAFIEPGDPGVVRRSLSDLAVLGRLSSADLLEVRILMTSEAIRLATERATDVDFARIEADIDETERLTNLGDVSARAEQIVEFYRILGTATHNEVYALVIDALTEIVQVRLAKAAARPRGDLVAVRREILAHMRRRDSDAAIQVLVDHLQRLELFLAEHEDKAENVGGAAPAKRGVRDDRLRSWGAASR